MSNHRFVTSLGSPYFAFGADNVGSLATLPSDGFVGVVIEVRVDRLPEQNASADELHPLFSFCYDTQSKGSIFEMGVTPSGRMKARVRSGDVWQTATGFFSDTTAWNTIAITYGVQAAGNWDVTLNGAPPNTSQTDPFPQTLLPDSGFGTRLMLFNGIDGLTKMSASIRAAEMSFSSPSRATTLAWQFLPGGQNTLPTSLISAASDMPNDCAMTARWYNPSPLSPWGAVPTGSLAAAYSRGLTTDYAAVARPTTAYTQVAS